MQFLHIFFFIIHEKLADIRTDVDSILYGLAGSLAAARIGGYGGGDGGGET